MSALVRGNLSGLRLETFWFLLSPCLSFIFNIQYFKKRPHFPTSPQNPDALNEVFFVLADERIEL